LDVVFVKECPVPESLDDLLKEGETHRREGRLKEALAVARRILDGTPDDPDGLALMGLVCLQAGDPAAAAGMLGRALGDQPLRADWHNALGIAHQNLGRAAEAEASFRRALAIEPANGAASNNLGGLLRALGRREEAAEALRKARLCAPDDPDVAVNLADALLDLGRFQELGPILIATLEKFPRHARAWSVMARAHRAADNIGQAIQAWNYAAQADPRMAEAHFALASLLAYGGDPEGALASFRRALDLAPDSAQVHDNLLLAMQHSGAVTREDLAAEHRRWAERHAPPAPPRPAFRDPDPERKLRVGFVSGDFRFHALAHFFLEPLRRRDRSRWEAFLYSTVATPDAATGSFRAEADRWLDVGGLDDEALAAAIRADGIDILVDLSGHREGNRLTAFALRPAPVLASWIGHADTTGLAAMDALIVDRILVRPEEEGFHAEPIRRLPDDAVCYTPPGYAPEVTPPPFKRNRHITFGCFNAARGIGPAAVTAWARALERVPGSRLLLNAPEFRHEAIRARYLGLFAERGIGAERLEFEVGGPHRDFLARYAEVDIALDPFPHSGGLNACEALWMGVPVVTFEGDRQAGRLAASHLRAAGLAELVAPDAGTAVDLAVALAGEPDRLKVYREELRPTLMRSPLCDASRFIRNFEALLRDLWREALAR
jgi:predicted O-linked N-acetylglucosamine transferase (SPINDLY family)